MGIATLLTVGLLVSWHKTAGASATLVVNSKADVVADDGECTLREAITAANSDTASGATPGECEAGDGADVIEFAITGTADFTSSTQDGYTITLLDALPLITTTVTIDGHSQPGSAFNTAASPAPMDGILLIEIDGTNLDPGPTDNLAFSCVRVVGASDVTINNLIVNNCGNNGIFLSETSGAVIQGNYIGVDPDGLTKQANGYKTSSAIGLGVMAEAVDHTLIGGTLPRERNVIAGNNYGDILVSSPYTGSDPDLPATNTYTTIQGNYLGVGKDGTTILPSGASLGAGNSILMTHSANDLIGGTDSGAKNVIASSNEYGISYRDGSHHNVIQGNYIGTDYTGNAPAEQPDGTPDCDPNPSNPCGVTGHPWGGVSVATISVTFQLPSHDIVIGGTTAAARNVISGNQAYDDGSPGGAPGITIHDGSYNVTIQGNYVGLGADGVTAVGNESNGIDVNNGDATPPGPTYNVLVGGTTAGAANTVAHNGNMGIAVNTDGTKAALLRNVIFNNGNLGIGFGFGTSPTSNDANDTDSGPNDYLNFPRLSNTSEADGNTKIFYRLDVPAGAYRIEFYDNDTADPSGHGEGQTFLGTTDVVSSGTGIQDYTYTLTGVTGINALAMTTTKIDASTPSGFSMTSEFSDHELNPVVDSSLEKTVLNPEDAAPGATLRYRLVFTNDGNADQDMSYFDGGSPSPVFTSVFADFLPPDVTYVSNTNPDITCTDLGTAISAILPNHPGYHLISCTYTGSGLTLTGGESIEDTLNVTVNSDARSSFTNYALAGLDFDDDDATAITTAVSTAFNSGGTIDALDLLLTDPVDNLSSAAVSLAATSSSEASGLDGLADTGLPVPLIVALAIGLVIAPGLWFIRQHLHS